MDSSVYVAGHGGLIGSALVRMLRARGCTKVVTRTRAELDLADPNAVENFFSKEKPEYVLLAAGTVGGIVANRDRPADFLAGNLAVELNVIGAAHRAGVRRLIFFASSCMYPREAPQPMAESALFSGRPEETSMGYAVAKIAGTQLCLAYNQQYGGKRFVPVIPNSVYGPHDNFDAATSHVLAALIARFHAAKAKGAASVTLWGSGKPRREFLYADDLAEACWLLLTADLSGVELPLNIGPGTDTSVRELASTIADTVGYGGKVEWDASMPDGAPRKLLDSSRMKKLGWQPQIPLAEGVRKTYEWYRAHA
jgi:GDP-L-fucose synthase